MDQALKQRLIGASILIALAVIFIPMLLDEPQPESASPTAMNIPPQPQPPTQTRRLPVVDDRAHSAANNRRDNDQLPVSAYQQAPAGDSSAADGPLDQGAGDAGLTKTKAIVPEFDLFPGRATAGQDAAPERHGAAAVPSGQRDDAGGGDGADNQDVSSGQQDSGTAASDKDTNAADGSPTTTDPTQNQVTTPGPGSGNNPDNDANQAVPVTPPTQTNNTILTPTPSSTTLDENSWALQVGSFSATENASRLGDRLRSMGFTPFMDTIYRGGSPLHRVRVGPFANQQAAVAASNRITAEITDVRPRPVPPGNVDITVGTAAAPAPEAERSQPDDDYDGDLARFSIQLGIFASEDNANRLLTRVRDVGYPAFVERMERSEGLRFIVKVGPLLTRRHATATRDRIERELGMKGIVQEYL